LAAKDSVRGATIHVVEQYLGAPPRCVANDHVADAVEVLNGSEPGFAADVLAQMPIGSAAHILGQPG
jgi:hypothetical protein